jgi:putative two-component system response regulator
MTTNSTVILAIDDNKDNLVVLKAIIGETFPNARVITSLDGYGGIRMAEKENPDVILLDILMPGLNGFEVCMKIKENNAIGHIPVVFLTALKTDRELRLKALDAGADAFLSKPIEAVELSAQISAMVKIKKANDLKRQKNEELEDLVAKRTFELQKRIVLHEKTEKELRSSEARLKNTLDSAIETIAAICEIKDPYTSGHQLQVSKIAFAIAEEMGLPFQKADNIRIGSMLHDIGKISVPPSILVKPGTLTEIEFLLIKEHSKIGYEILKKMDISPSIPEMVLQHHERLNGSGYPNGLMGYEILLESKIIAVADVVEAMTSHRPYRPALGRDKAVEEVIKNKATLYDCDVVDACLNILLCPADSI